MSIEKQMIKFINVARQHPTYFISLVQNQINSFTNDREIPLNDQIIYQTNQGKKVWSEALNFLKQQKSIPCLQQHQGLTSSAQDHVFDLVKNNIFGHTGTDGSTFSERILKYCRKGHGSMAELIGADFNFQNRNHAQMTILGLIIDDGVPDRGHRKTIFNPAYQFIGCKSEIQGQKIITVFNITQNKLSLRSESSVNNGQSTFQNKNTYNSQSGFGNKSPNNTNTSQFSNNNRKPPIQQMQNTKKSSPRANQYQNQPNNQRFCKTQQIFSKINPNNLNSSKSPSRKQTKQPFFETSNKINTNPSKSSTENINFNKTNGSTGSKDQVNNLNKSRGLSRIKDRKLCEKKESSKTYYEQGAKVTQITTTLVYNDGTIQQKIDKHTVYLEQ